MSSLFDVDCPRTPDGDSKEDPPQPQQRMQKKRNIPPMAPTKPPRISRKDPRNKSTSSSSGRSRSTPRRVGGGLEPEEYIAPTKNGIEVSPSSGGNAAQHNNRPRAFSSGGTGYPSRVPSAPSSGPSRYVPPRAPSSGPSAYTAAPNSGGGLVRNDVSGSSHPRTNSGDWWKEEITDESENKGEFWVVDSVPFSDLCISNSDQSPALILIHRRFDG